MARGNAWGCSATSGHIDDLKTKRELALLAVGLLRGVMQRMRTRILVNSAKPPRLCMTHHFVKIVPVSLTLVLTYAWL